MSSNENHLPPILLIPEGPYRTGDTVTGTWTLLNWSDSPISGMRLRVFSTKGLSVIKERSRIPDVEAHDLHLAFAKDGEGVEGVILRDLEPGERITATFTFMIERVSAVDDLWIQAEVESGGDRLRSPMAPVRVSLTPRISVPTPEIFAHKADSQNFGMRMTVLNDGGAPEHNLVMEIPIPEVLEVSEPIIPEEAEVDYNPEKRVLRIQISEVKPYDKQEIGLQFRAGQNLVGDLVEITDIVVSSPSSGTFHLDPIVARLERHVDFSQSAILIEPGPYVESGSPVLVTVHIHNHGRSAARDAQVHIELPETLVYAHGSLAINGAHDARRDDLYNILLPLVRAHTTTTITLNATVISPVPNQTRSEVKATVDGFSIESLEIAIESRPDYPIEENYIFVEGPCTVEPRAERIVVAKVTNAGTETSRQVRVRVEAGEIAINRATVYDGNTEHHAGIIPIYQAGAPSSAIDLGEIGPQESRLVRMYITASETFVHGTSFPLVCYIRHDGNNEHKLGELVFLGRSFPHISQESSYLRNSRMGPLRVGQPRNIAIHLTNDGSDVARNVRVALDLPSNIEIQGVSGAKLEDDGRILFNEIPGQASAEATLVLRMSGTGSGESNFEIHPIVSGERMNTVHLKALTLTTSSQSFLDEVRVDTIPNEHEAALLVLLMFRNVGDGEATNVVVRNSNFEGYSINTTSIDGNVIRDIRGQSPLLYGLCLPPVAPGKMVEISFRVNLGDRPYAPQFIIESDDQETINAVGDPYRAPLRHLFLPQYLTTEGKIKSNEAQKAIAGDTIDVPFREVNAPSSGLRNTANRPAQEEQVSAETIEIAKDSEVSQTTSEENTNTSHDNSESKDLKNDRVNLEKTEADNVEVPEVADEIQEKTLTQEHEDEDEFVDTSTIVIPNTPIAETPIAKTVDETNGLQEEVKIEDSGFKAEDAVLAAQDILLRGVESPTSKAKVETDSEDVDTSELNTTLKNTPVATSDEEDEHEEDHIERAPSRLIFNAPKQVTAPVIVVKFDEERIQQIRTGLDLLFKKDEIGWYRHIFAMRLLAGDRLVGADVEIEDAWNDIRTGMSRDLKLPLFQLVMPTFQPNETWAAMLDSSESLEATGVLIREIPKLIAANVTLTLPTLADNEIYSVVEDNNFAFFDDAHEEISPGFLDAVIPEMIPTVSDKWPDLGEALRLYRDKLTTSFKMNAYKTPKARHDHMIKGPHEAMDQALQGVLNAIESEIG